MYFYSTHTQGIGSSARQVNGNQFSLMKSTKVISKDEESVNPGLAIKFHEKNETQELFKALDLATHKCMENIIRFEKADKKDTYLNGYKVDENKSPVVFPPQLQLVKENTTDSYNVFNDLYTMRSLSRG